MAREKLNALIAFLAVARERSFAKGAAKLGVSPSALIYMLRGLEDSLGVRLLTRTTRSVSLTDAGERLLGSVGPHFDGIEESLASLTELRDKPAGAVRLVAGEHAAEAVLWPAVKRLRQDYPDISVESPSTTASPTSSPNASTQGCARGTG